MSYLSPSCFCLDGGGGGVLICCLPYDSHLTIDHASFRGGAPFLRLIKTSPTFGRSLRLFHILHRNFLLILSPSCFAVCCHHLSPRIATVFSLLQSSVPNFSMSHSSIFLITVPFMDGIGIRLASTHGVSEKNFPPQNVACHASLKECTCNFLQAPRLTSCTRYTESQHFTEKKNIYTHTWPDEKINLLASGLYWLT